MLTPDLLLSAGASCCRLIQTVAVIASWITEALRTKWAGAEFLRTILVVVRTDAIPRVRRNVGCMASAGTTQSSIYLQPASRPVAHSGKAG